MGMATKSFKLGTRLEQKKINTNYNRHTFLHEKYSWFLNTYVNSYTYSK